MANTFSLLKLRHSISFSLFLTNPNSIHCALSLSRNLVPPLLESWSFGCIISSFSFDLIVKVLALTLFLFGFEFLVLCGISDLWMWVFNLWLWLVKAWVLIYGYGLERSTKPSCTDAKKPHWWRLENRPPTMMNGGDEVETDPYDAIKKLPKNHPNCTVHTPS